MFWGKISGEARPVSDLTWVPVYLKSHFFQFTATNTSHKIIPFGVGEFDGVVIFANGHALIANLHGGTTGTGRTENNLNPFHILHLLSKECYTFNLSLR